ncbi:MAG: hypothetical protein GX410_02440 [Elusimicrobia bacterium]|nr:hypothetical protein [Elusimicrobiota bacterium]
MDLGKAFFPEHEETTLCGRKARVPRLTLAQLCAVGQAAAKLKQELAAKNGEKQADWEFLACGLEAALEGGHLRQALKAVTGEDFSQEELRACDPRELAAFAAALLRVNDFKGLWLDFTAALRKGPSQPPQGK